MAYQKPVDLFLEEGARKLREEERALKAAREARQRETEFCALQTGCDGILMPDPDARQEWPFKDMVVGEVESFHPVLSKKAQTAAHAYMYYARLRNDPVKFKTWFEGDVCFVKRVA